MKHISLAIYDSNNKQHLKQIFACMDCTWLMNFYTALVISSTFTLDILRQRTKDNEVKKYCVSLLEKYGSFEYTRNKLAELRKEAIDELQKLGDNPFMTKVIEVFLKI